MATHRCTGELPQWTAQALDGLLQEAAKQAEAAAHIIVNVPTRLEVLSKAHLHIHSSA